MLFHNLNAFVCSLGSGGMRTCLGTVDGACDKGPSGTAARFHHSCFYNYFDKQYRPHGKMVADTCDMNRCPSCEPPEIVNF
jgi:hypothetical protein